MTNRTIRLVLVLAAGAGSAALARGDWPNFRGPNHDGISTESGFQTAWSKPIPVVWEAKVGAAFSSFACVGDRVYTCGTENGKQTLVCLSADAGKAVWSIPLEGEYREGMGGDGPRATPTVHDGRVYVLGALGKLICVSAADGKEIWSKQFKHVPQWGYSGSVLIEGNLAVTSGGKDQGGLIAYDRASGKEIWKTGDEPAGYATPYPFTFEGKRYIVGFTGVSAIIVEAETGREVWQTKWKTDYDVNAAAPIFHEGHLFLTSGYRTGSALYKLKKDGDKLAGEEVWRNKTIMAKFQSAILHQGCLYISDQAALVCVDFKTGAEKWRTRRSGQGDDKRTATNGTLVLADGYLLFLTEDGSLQIGRADPAKFEPTTSASVLDGRCWCVPVLDRGRLYARNLDRVICLNLRP